jgi:hypothetical protein
MNETWSTVSGMAFVLGGAALVAVVIVVIAWQIFAVARTKMVTEATIAHEAAYRKLAEQSAVTQEQIAARLDGLENSMSDLRDRVASIEKMLREVS